MTETSDPPREAHAEASGTEARPWAEAGPSAPPGIPTATPEPGFVARAPAPEPPPPPPCLRPDGRSSSTSRTRHGPSTWREVERQGIETLVVSLLRRVPEDGLYQELWGKVEVHLVGDASAVRPTEKVILEAAVLARRL